MNILKSTIACACALLAPQAGAQTETPKWTLDRCVAYAVEHNIEVRRQMLQVSQSELGVREAQDRLLPTLSGYASESFSFGRGLTADNTYADRNTNSFSMGAQLSLPLFQGLRNYRNIKYQKASLRAVIEQNEALKDNVTVNVIGQFLQVLYARENLAVALLKLELSLEELHRRELLLEAGKIPELDLFEARSQVSQDEVSVVTARNDSTIAVLDLANLLNLKSAEGFDIEPLDSVVPPVPELEAVWSNVLANNHSIRAGQLQLEAAEQNIAVAQTGYIPTLSFNAGLGTNYYKTSGMPNASAGSQLRHNFSQSLGFSLNVPIFDAFSTRNSIKRARLQKLSSQLELENTSQQLYKTITTAHAQAVAASRRERASLAAVESTRAALEAMTVKYDNGKANSTEYETARNNYTNSLLQCVQSHYENLLRVKILQYYSNVF